MTKNKYPNYECGECPIWLGFEGPIEEMREMCRKRECYLILAQDLLPPDPEDIKRAIITITERMKEAREKEEEYVDCDGRCLNCDYFDHVRGCTVEEK